MAILTNEYHIPRTSLFYRMLGNLVKDNPELDQALRQIKERGLEIKFVAAEDILLHRRPHYFKLIESAKLSTEYLKRVESEQGSLKQIRSGTYKIRTKR